MAITNGIAGQDYTFSSGVGSWSGSNAALVRSLNSSVYRNFTLVGSTTPLTAEHALKVTADGVGVASAELSGIVVDAETQVVASAMVTTDLDSSVRNSYVRASVEFFDGAGSSLSTSTGDAVDVTLENAGSRFWTNVRFSAAAPALAESAKLTFSFTSGGSSYGTTPTVGDVWLIAAPALVVVDELDFFTTNMYDELPEFVRQADTDASGHLLRYMLSVFSSSAAIRELAKGLRFDRPIDGDVHLPSLVDTASMPVEYFAWLASVLGVQLGSSASAAGSNWSTLITLADTDAGRAHNASDGTAGDGIVTWAEWNREFGTISSGTADFTQADDTWTTAEAHGLSVGDSLEFTSADTNPSEYSTAVTYYVVAAATTTFQLSTTPGGSVLVGTVDSAVSWGYDALASFDWSGISSASSGSFDGVPATRLLLKHAASGVHAGKLSTMDAFLREFVNPAYQFFLKPLEYSSPQFTGLVADSRDVTDGGLILQNFLDLISPAGTSTVVSASSTPMKEAATFAFLSDYYGEAVGTFGPQGLANEAGGAITAALMASQIDDLPVLGGIIGPAPFGPGCALLSGYRVAAEEVDADYDLGVSGSTENFDLIIGVSSVTLPPAGGGTSSATIPADSRYLARGENWSLHLNNAGNVILVWDINGTPQTLTSAATGTADFTASTNTWATSSAHGLSVGDTVEFTSSDAAPSEYSTGVTYYVVSTDTTTAFQLSTSAGGSVLAGTADSGASWGYDAIVGYDFDNKSDVAVQYIRVNKVGTALKLYVQDSLFSDWDDNQLGTDLTITTSAITGATSDYLRVLESDDPSSNDFVGSLPCAVHRVLLFTASSGSAWAESAGEYYDYEGHANKVFDLDFGELDSSNYYDTSVVVTGGTFDINDNGGANLNAAAAANDLTIANDGIYDYVNVSTQEVAVYDDEPLFVHDEFSMSVTVKDALSTSAFDLVDYAHTDISTNFTIEFVQSSGIKLRVSLTDGTNTLTHDVDASSWSGPGSTVWHTVTATYSAGNGLTVYVDGVEDGSDDSADLVLVDTSQNSPAVDLGRLSNVMIGGGSGATGDVDCRYVAFHQFEMTAAQALALAGELG
jgi:hypothetical protein